MKKIFATLCMALTAVAMMAQQPVITFEKTEHDFGKINEADGRVSVVFTFKNEGMSPLVLSNVRASCGCTTPTWTKEPVEPGQTGSITVTYNPNGRPGRFQKTVTITSNATEATKKVFIKGEVIPKQVKQTSPFNIPAGEISLKTKTLDLGDIKKGEVKGGDIEYANLTTAAHNVDLAVSAANGFLTHQISLPTVQPNEVGKFLFVFDTKATKLYGEVEAFVYIVVDGKKEISETYKLTVRANIVEDFSGLSVDQLHLAPILETAAEIDLGSIAAGKITKQYFPVKNNGVNPLEIRRVYANDKNIVFKPCKAVKSGKKGAINVEINTKGMAPGKYSRQILLITNDPKQAQKKITLNWRVE